ncbi:unannotated protein [freshwater metagenome]|uniref:Unannotated protein n=1 Tax=freshwater metagenome TaxID=449393 RepID=A0A6J7F670_9ZZZZ
MVANDSLMSWLNTRPTPIGANSRVASAGGSELTSSLCADAGAAANNAVPQIITAISIRRFTWGTPLYRARPNNYGT